MLYKNLFIFLFVLFGTNLVMAEGIQHHQKVDGMDVYLDVIPMQHTQKHSSMHGGTVNKEDSYHIVIALFDIKSGKRITDASVKASVTPLGREDNAKDLEPTHGDPLSYGNYFTMQKAVHYNIKVEIQRANEKAKSITMFILKPPQN